MKVGIIGAAGYTGGELIRLLIHHPHVELVSVVSHSQTGLDITSIHKDLKGDTELKFSGNLANDVELIFLCRGHGESKNYLDANPNNLDLHIIDLSTDYRPRNNSLGFTYGLPEINKQKIAIAKKIANPGCFATAIQLSILPLAMNQSLKNSISINAITGATGAGQKPMSSTHFSYRSNNLSIYKLFEHQHIAEITESITQLQNDFDQDLLFVPIRGDFPRGIFASVHTETELELDEIKTLYAEYYKDHPFVTVSEDNISLKEVINTNKCFLQVNKYKNTVHITSVIDNLLKGASGQAVQNMNIMMSWPENTGLNLKSIAF